MMSMDFDPHVGQATFILSLCLIMITMQIVLHLYRYIRSLFSPSDLSNQDPENHALPLNSEFFIAKTITILFQYLLTILYMGFVLYFIISSFSLFKSPVQNLDLYASQLIKIYLLQILTAITAYLLGYFAKQTMDGVIQKGYQLMLLDVLFETLYQTITLTFNHWIQVVELNIICLLLIISPLLRSVFFKNQTSENVAG